MMFNIIRISFLLAVCFAGSNTVLANSEIIGEWSTPVNGLRGRLAVAEGAPLENLHVVNAYLELQNVSDVGNPLEIYYQDSSLRGQLLNNTGENLSGAGFPASIITPLPYRLVVPYDGTLRFRISVTGYFVPKKERGTLLGLSNDAWLMKSGEKYFLQAIFTAVKSGEAGHREWMGTLQLPKRSNPLVKVGIGWLNYCLSKGIQSDMRKSRFELVLLPQHRLEDSFLCGREYLEQ